MAIENMGKRVKTYIELSKDSSRSQRWYQGAAPSLTGQFFGGVIGVLLIAPALAATWLERTLGDGWTIAILAMFACLMVTVSVLFFIKKRYVEGWIFVVPVLSSLFAIYITVTMQW